MSSRPGSEADLAEVDLELAWQDALLAASLLAVDPPALGGVVVRAGAGPVRDLWLARLQRLLLAKTRTVRMPAQITEERLLGGLDLAATLRLGQPVHQPGFLADADGAVIVAPMAERLAASTVAVIAGALDRDEFAVERDGVSALCKTRFALVALDESTGDEDGVAPQIADRLALHIDLSQIPYRLAHAEIAGPVPQRDDVSASEQALDRAGAIEALVAVASSLGIGSLRAPLLAYKAARAAAVLRGAEEINESDLQAAARLVLAPRATQIPLPPQEEQDEQQSHEDPPEPPTETPGHDENEPPPSGEPNLEDIVLDAATSSLPKGLLAKLAEAAAASKRAAKSSGKSGPSRRTPKRGRPAGVGRGQLGGGARLAIVDTLRAAAPWQRLRKASGNNTGASNDRSRSRRIEVRSEDFRFRRFAERSEALTVFIVDASGSTALHRLGEAKGAVELLLADCYVRRDWVSLVALRGREAELILQPTRALARAKRDLAGLPGGGGTPLASGIEKSLHLALAARRRDQQPRLVILTDGAANVARDGRTGRRAGEEDALAAAMSAVALGVPSMLIDTGPRPSPFAARLAETMRGRYFALPMADAKTLSAVVKSASANA